MQIENNKVRELVRALDLDEDAVYAEYSGRGMYGRSCFGIRVGQYDNVNETLLGVALAEVFGSDDAWDIARSMRSDSLGLGSIIYFPGWEIEDAEEFAEV